MPRRAEVPRSQDARLHPGRAGGQRPAGGVPQRRVGYRARDALRSGGHVVEHTRTGACCCRRWRWRA
jgi:hypothetical protein